jgi:hypothetical protein
MYNSIGKLRRIVRLVETRLNSSENNNKLSAVKKTAHRLVNESLLKEAKQAIRNGFIGLLVTPLGIAFFWLFGNSLHFTETPWIGGLLGLIDALTVMEICLFPLLVYMVVDGFDYFNLHKQTKELIGTIETQSLKTPDSITLTKYECMNPDWNPFWESGITPFFLADESEAKRIEQEVSTVERTLLQWFPPTTSEKDEKEDKIRKQALDRCVQSMKDGLLGLSMKGYREFLYFVLNFVAFYGYLMGIVTFYYPEDDAQPKYVTQMKFGYTNALADWTGNFAGDLMWTIEPVVILGSPLYLSYLSSSNNKTTTSASDDDKKKKE